jgi:hypothetical protein
MTTGARLKYTSSMANEIDFEKESLRWTFRLSILTLFSAEAIYYVIHRRN